MTNADILAKMIASGITYWMVSCPESAGYIRLVAIPDALVKPGGCDEKAVTYGELCALKYSKMDHGNMFFGNANYPPFQIGMTFYDVADGFPMPSAGKIDWQELIAKCCNLRSDKLFEYKMMIDELVKEAELQNEKQS